MINSYPVDAIWDHVHVVRKMIPVTRYVFEIAPKGVSVSMGMYSSLKWDSPSGVE